MAIYSFSAGVFSRSKGQRATAAAAYRSGDVIRDNLTGERFDYSRKRGILHSEIIAPTGAPDWMSDRAALWNAVEAQEKRSDSQLAREVMVALPHELDDDERLALVRDFIREQFVSRGMVADVSIHEPSREGDERNHHAHIMLTMRAVNGDGFASKKAREWNSDTQLEEWRKAWAEHCNAALENAGFECRVDHRSLEAQGLDRAPGAHLGKHATALERQGIFSDRGDMNRDAADRNTEIEQLVAELATLDAEIAREQQERALGEGFGAFEPQTTDDVAPSLWSPLPVDAPAEEKQVQADSAPFTAEIQQSGAVREVEEVKGAPSWWQRGAQRVAEAMTEFYGRARDMVSDTWQRFVKNERDDPDRNRDIEPEF